MTECISQHDELGINGNLFSKVRRNKYDSFTLGQYYVTREYWDSTVKNYITEMVGGDIVRPVPADLLAGTEPMKIPENAEI